MSGADQRETPGRRGDRKRTTRRTDQPRFEAASLAPPDTSITDLIGVVQKRRLAALVAFLAVVVPALPIIMAAPSVFEASARLLIEPAVATPIQLGDSRTASGGSETSFETQYEGLRSRALAQKTIEELKLWESPAFLASHEGVNIIGGIRRALAAVASVFGGATRATSGGASPAEKAAGLVDTLLGRLTVLPVARSQFVDVVIAARDPQLAASIANTVARLYVEQDLEARFEAARSASAWLDSRLTEQRGAVDASEAALQRYREQHRSVPLDDRQNIVVQRLADLNAAVTKAKTDRIQKEELYNQLTALQNDRAAADTFPLILSNAYIQQLKGQIADLQREQAQLAEKYGERHPDMVRVRTALQAAETRLQSEIAKVADSVRNDFLAAQAQEQSLTDALEVQKRQTLGMNRIAIEYGSLQREVATNRQVLDTLLQQAKETGLAAAAKATNIRVAEKAVAPEVPARPRRLRNLLVTAFAAGLFSLGLVFLLEYLDARLKSPEEVRSYLGVPFLGIVPLVSTKVLDHSSPLITKHASSDFGEAFRRVRTNLLLSTSRDDVKTLAVTSTGPREGKSVVASNLAIVLAQAGRRVLLLDADMRRPRIHELFDRPQQPGLSGTLVTKGAIAGSVHPSDVAGLDILTAGSPQPNPAELLGSPMFRKVLDSLIPTYDHIVVDCPPVMAVTDAAIIGHEVSGVVFVVGTDMATRGAARTAVEELASARANILGAILNRANLKGNTYYYSRYYRPEYERYYSGRAASR